MNWFGSWRTSWGSSNDIEQNDERPERWVLDRRLRNADAVQVTARRPILLVLGLIGLGFGVAALAADVPALGLVAGIVAAMVAGVAIATSGAPTSATMPPGAATLPPPTGPTPATGANAVVVLPSAGNTPMSHADAALIDPSTGLFTEEYFRVAVETRVLAARRHLRPVAIVLFDVIEGLGPGASHQADPAPVASAIKHTLREADTACRLADGRYGFVLEDTPEDGAIWTVERLRRKLSEFQPDQTRWAGVACYPAHAFSADEVMAKAEEAFAAAREWAQDRIEVAATD
jgi:GGDEF domain-containing protein